MTYSVHTLTTPEACQEALATLNYTHKNHLYHLLGLELKQERMLGKMAALEQKSLRVRAELDVLDILLPQLSGKHKTRQEVKQVKWIFQNWQAEAAKDKHNPIRLLMLESQAGERRVSLEATSQAIQAVIQRQAELMTAPASLPLPRKAQSAPYLAAAMLLKPLPTKRVLPKPAASPFGKPLQVLRQAVGLVLVMLAVRVVGLPQAERLFTQPFARTSPVATRPLAVAGPVRPVLGRVPHLIFTETIPSSRSLALRMSSLLSSLTYSTDTAAWLSKPSPMALPV